MFRPSDYRSVATRQLACPCCAGQRHRTAFVGDRYGFGLRTVVCCHCGFLFTNPRPSDAWFAGFYRRDYRRFYLGHEQPDPAVLQSDDIRGRHERNLDTIQPFIPAQGRLLDVGCADGTFLDAFRRRFPSWDLQGVDPSEAYTAFARSHYGLAQIVTGGLDDWDDWQAAEFDVVTGNHVLEHLSDPNHFFRQARRLLRPGGMLFADVPDAEGQRRGIDNVHIAHLSHFSQRSLRNFLQKHGFQPLLVATGREPVPWTVQVLAERQPAIDAAWTAPPANARRIAARFARHCRIGMVSRVRGKVRRLIRTYRYAAAAAAPCAAEPVSEPVER